MKLKRNIPLIYIITSLTWGRFFLPVIALFYIASQVPLEQFAIIMSIFALSILILEIPSGIIADLLGKKKTLLLGTFCWVVEIFLIAFFNGFWIFLAAKIISGIGVSLYSGADSAILFDTLKKQKREKEHKRISGSIYTISNISKAFVMIIGGVLFAISAKLPAIASLPLITLGFILTFFLEEPYKNNKKINVENSIKHLKESLSYFKNSDFVKYISFFALFTAMAINIVLSLSSAYFEKILIPIYLMGFIAFVGSLITAFSSKKAHKWEKKLGEKKSLRLIQIFIIVALFLISLMLPYIGVLFFLLIAFVLGFYEVIINDYMNHHIESSHRATLISIKNFFGNIGIFLLFPIIGFLIKIKSMGFSFGFFGIIVLIGYILVYFSFRKSDISFLSKTKLNKS
jgi:MFS family permease